MQSIIFESYQNFHAVPFIHLLSQLWYTSFPILAIKTFIYFLTNTSYQNSHTLPIKTNTLPFTHFLPNFSVTSYQNFHYLPFQQFLSESIHFLSHTAYQNSHTLHHILRPVFIHFAIVVVASGVNHGQSWVTGLPHLYSTFRYKSWGMMESDASSSGF